jgi:hypothetical protein
MVSFTRFLMLLVAVFGSFTFAQIARDDACKTLLSFLHCDKLMTVWSVLRMMWYLCKQLKQCQEVVIWSPSSLLSMDSSALSWQRTMSSVAVSACFKCHSSSYTTGLICIHCNTLWCILLPLYYFMISSRIEPYVRSYLDSQSTLSAHVCATLPITYSSLLLCQTVTAYRQTVINIYATILVAKHSS